MAGPASALLLRCRLVSAPPPPPHLQHQHRHLRHPVAHGALPRQSSGAHGVCGAGCRAGCITAPRGGRAGRRTALHTPRCNPHRVGRGAAPAPAPPRRRAGTTTSCHVNNTHREPPAPASAPPRHQGYNTGLRRAAAREPGTGGVGTPSRRRGAAPSSLTPCVCVGWVGGDTSHPRRVGWWGRMSCRRGGAARVFVGGVVSARRRPCMGTRPPLPPVFCAPFPTL